MEDTILFGNGFNRIGNNASWNDLLSKINFADKNVIPNTIIYETEILSGKDIKFGKELQYDKNSEYQRKDKIAQQMKDYESNFCYDCLVSLEADHYLTTNYDHTLLNAFQEEGYTEFGEENSEKTYNIRRHYKLIHPKKQKTCTIWPIHGDIENPVSMMLGLDQYCGTIGKMNEYLKGKYKYGKEQKVVEELSKRLKNRKITDSISWIDFFFVTNIHIIALSLVYEEIDLWWLLVWRKRAIEKYGKELIQNTIYYYGEVNSDKQKILETMGVKVVIPEKVKCNDENEYYKQIYGNLLSKMEENIKRNSDE